eukprot:7319992-Ditylum_brightwellii.AAC.1
MATQAVTPLEVVEAPAVAQAVEVAAGYLAEVEEAQAAKVISTPMLTDAITRAAIVTKSMLCQLISEQICPCPHVACLNPTCNAHIQQKTCHQPRRQASPRFASSIILYKHATTTAET